MTEPTSLPPTIEEPGADVAVTTPVLPVTPAGQTPPPQPGRRLRWAVALVVVALAVGATAAAAALLTGASSPSTVARWAPADAVGFVEVRADLPGDQRAALGEFLSAFPGFADQTILDRKLDELYEQLFAAASKGKQSWSADIAPWFGGQVGAAFGPLPAGTATEPSAMARAGRGLVIATTTDPAKALAWVRASATEAGKTVTATTHGGVDMLVVGPTDRPMAAAATSTVLLVGDRASVEAAIDRGGDAGLATTDRFRTAIAALPGDRLSTTYLDTAALVARLADMPGAAATDALAKVADLIPAWAAGSLRVESDALVADGAVPRTEGSPDIADAESQLPSHLPATTMALAEGHAVGQTLIDALTRGSGADAGAAREDIDKALAPVGGLDAVIGWIGEAGLVVLPGDQPLVGLVAIPTDPKAADALAKSLRNLASIGGLQPTETEHAGATIVTIDLTKLVGFAGGALPGGAAPAMPGGYRISYAVTDDLAIVGVDQAFVEAILDTPAGQTLADQAGFRDLVARAGARHRALTWVDLDAFETAVTAHLEPAERTRFERDVKPYLAPLSAAVGVVTRDGDLDRTHGLVVLGEGR